MSDVNIKITKDVYYYIFKYLSLIVSALLGIGIVWMLLNVLCMGFLREELYNKTVKESYMYDVYKYSDSGENIYVDYHDEKRIKVLNYTVYKYDPIFFKLNNCKPEVVIYKYVPVFDWLIEPRVDKTVKCIVNYPHPA